MTDQNTRPQPSAEPATVWRDHMSMAHALIQEAKGADHPNGGYITDHLDAAENWMERADAVIADALEAARREDQARIATLEADNARLMGLVKEVGEALEDIGVYGCGMLNQPAALNGPEEAWLRQRIHRMEQVARTTLARIKENSRAD